MKKYLKYIVLYIFFLNITNLNAAPVDDYFRAIQQDNESAVITQALRGVDLNTLNSQGEHGLLVALRSSALKVADFFLGQPGVKVEVRNPSGESALMMAALKGHLPQARRLIALGAEVNKPGWAPLHYAASNAEPISREMVQLLLEHHAYIDASSPNRSTPLMMAAHYGHPSVVKLLLESDADPLIKNEQGLSAIDFAQRAGRADVAGFIAATVRASQPAGRW
jgi:ankyrin repeat protein